MVRWCDLPVEIQDKMLDEQEAQGNKRDTNVFTRLIYQDKEKGGFNWKESEDDYEFWDKIINNEDFSEFYNKYPKEYISVLEMPNEYKTKEGILIAGGGGGGSDYFNKIQTYSSEKGEPQNSSGLIGIKKHIEAFEVGEEKKEINKIYVRKYK